MEKDKSRKEAPPLPPAAGLRRSTRLNHPPPPPRSEGGSDDPQGEVGDGENVSVQGSSKKVVTNPDGGGDDGSLEDGSGVKRSPNRRQPLPLENGKAQLKGGEAISGPDKASASPPGVMTRSSAAAAAAGRSEVMSFDTATEEEEAHPCLFIENILDVIFKHIAGKQLLRTDPNATTDVQNIRLVCKTWKTSITRIYRKNRDRTEFDRYDNRRSNFRGAKKPLTQFMKTMKSSQMIPVQKYSFRGHAFRRNNLKMFREFLLLCGPEAVELSMDVSLGDAERIMSNLEHLPTLEMKKLKSLFLMMHVYDCPEDEFEVTGLVRLLELLLIAGTAVEEVWVVVEVEDSKPFGSSHDLVQQVSLVIAKSMARTAKKLELNADLNETAFNTLAGMKAKLDRAILYVPSQSESRDMYQFLQSQATSLKDLQISGYDKEFIVEFPRLDELLHLRLPHNVSITGGLDFGETFPKLHSLKMNDDNPLSAVLSAVKKPFRSLKALKVFQRGLTCPAELVKGIAQSFPCLAKLCISLQGDDPEAERMTMEEVFTYLDTLESLHITFFDFNQSSNWVDSLFGGISERDCERISRQDFGAVNLNEFQRLPSILNLKNLKKLKIQEHHGVRKVAFTDVSAHFVFMEMDNLHEIMLANSTARKFSPRYLELLRDKLDLRPWNYA